MAARSAAGKSAPGELAHCAQYVFSRRLRQPETGPRGKRIVDLIATVVLVGFLAVFAYMLIFKVESGYRSGESTFDTRMPVWPFHAVAALGIFLATLLTVVRFIRLLRGTRTSVERPIEPVQ